MTIGNGGNRYQGVIAIVALVALSLTGCTYTQVAQSPPEYEEYVEPDPYPYYEGPFDELSAWGEWIDTGPFGWVWRPYVGGGWQPYYHGNWVWTDWGWAWVSYEPFGWAAYHYGFWHYDAIYGWVWIPDDQWFPARVSWMHYGDYIYWAPIPPPGYYIPDPWEVHVDFIWVGVNTNHFLQNDIGRYRIKKSGEVWRRVPRAKVRRDAPTDTYISKRTRRKVRTVDVRVEKIKKGGREYERMILPPEQKRSIDRYEKRREESVRPQTKSRDGQPRAKKQRPTSKNERSKDSSSSKKGKSKPDSPKTKDKK